MSECGSDLAITAEERKKQRSLLRSCRTFLLAPCRADEVHRWPRPSKGSTSAADSLESGLESQNDAHLNDLHSKLQALRGVRSPLPDDAELVTGDDRHLSRLGGPEHAAGWDRT